jgi:hypothetical protein
MPLHSGRGSLGLWLHRGLGNAPAVVHPLDAVAEGVRVLQRIGLGRLLGEGEARDQVDQVGDDRRDAHAARLVFIVGDHASPASSARKSSASPAASRTSHRKRRISPG